MEKRKRLGMVLLILAGFALALCAGMVIGGAVVYGALRIDDYLSSRLEQEEPQVLLKETYEELSMPRPASGVLVTEVLPGSPAADAGLQVGDQILAVDGKRVGPVAGALARLIAQYEPGDRITLEVQAKDGSSRQVSVTLGESPNAAGAPFLGVYPRPAMMRGMPLERLLPFIEEGEWSWEDIPMPRALDVTSIMVASVMEGSPAADAGLQHGDTITSLDGEPLGSAAALVEAVAAHEPGDRITLGVLHAGDETEVELEIRLGEHPEEAGKAYLGVTLGDLIRSFRHYESPGGVEKVPTPPLP